MHVGRQAAHVVVRLDDVRLAGLGAGGLDDVRVDGALRQEVDVRELLRFLVEHLHEQAPMILRLLFRVGLAAQRFEETRSASTRMTFTPRLSAKIFMTWSPSLRRRGRDPRTRTQLVADGLVQQRGDDRGIHAARQAQQHLALAHLRAHADGVFDDVADAPQRLAAMISRTKRSSNCLRSVCASGWNCTA